MFEFALPWVFVLLILPALAYLFLPKHKNQSSALLVPFYKRVAQFQNTSQTSHSQSLLRSILLALSYLLLVAAAAQPQWVGESITSPASGRDLLLAVDISGSMETPDMTFERRQLQRIDVVKLVVGDFVQRRENDRLGLILFGSQAYLQAPLTYDRTTVETLLREAQLGFAGGQTAIGDAIGLSIKRLRDRAEASRVVILLTDGANTAGEIEPRQAADLAKLAGIKIYTIGVGATEMVQQTFFGARKINPSVDLDEDTLTYIAEQTGGQYFRARNPKELIEIYQELDRLEPIELEEKVFRPVSALFYWPLGAALFCSFLLAASYLSLNFISSNKVRA